MVILPISGDVEKKKIEIKIPGHKARRWGCRKDTFLAE